MSEFVFGISASGSAIVVNQTGAPTDFPVRCLINRGLPPKGRKRVRVEIDLSRLLPLPAAEYLDVFGMTGLRKKPATGRHGQQGCCPLHGLVKVNAVWPQSPCAKPHLHQIVQQGGSDQCSK